MSKSRSFLLRASKSSLPLAPERRPEGSMSIVNGQYPCPSREMSKEYIRDFHPTGNLRSLGAVEVARLVVQVLVFSQVCAAEPLAERYGGGQSIEEMLDSLRVGLNGLLIYLVKLHIRREAIHCLRHSCTLNAP